LRQRNVKKKIGSLFLAAAMVITSFPASSATEVQAAEQWRAAPNLFVTKEQLKTFDTDAHNSNGKNPAKVYFGKSS